MSAVVWNPGTHDLTRKNRDALLAELKEKLAGRVLAALIFGSFAKGSHNSESDIDIVLVKATNINFTERPLEFADLLDVFSPMDILVYTPEEFERKKSEPQGFFANTHFLKII
jgi:predicted nucleotidyltransferase